VLNFPNSFETLLPTNIVENHLSEIYWVLWCAFVSSAGGKKAASKAFHFILEFFSKEGNGIPLVNYINVPLQSVYSISWAVAKHICIV
jgi:hypothetical protein